MVVAVVRRPGWTQRGRRYRLGSLLDARRDDGFFAVRPHVPEVHAETNRAATRNHAASLVLSIAWLGLADAPAGPRRGLRGFIGRRARRRRRDLRRCRLARHRLARHRLP